MDDFPLAPASGSLVLKLSFLRLTRSGDVEEKTSLIKGTSKCDDEQISTAVQQHSKQYQCAHKDHNTVQLPEIEIHILSIVHPKTTVQFELTSPQQFN